MQRLNISWQRGVRRTRRTNGDDRQRWSLADIVEQRLVRFLFAEEDVNDANFGALTAALEEQLTTDTRDGPKLREDGPQTFAALPEWIQTPNNRRYSL